MKTPIKITQEKTLMVYWILTDFCNFSCNYCPDFLHSGDFATGKKLGFPTDEEIFKFIDQLQHISETKKIKLQVQFGGGEPLIMEEHFEMLKFLHKSNKNITIKYTTNLSFFFISFEYSTIIFAISFVFFISNKK